MNVDDSALRGITLDLWSRWNQDIATATLLARRDHPAVARLIPYAERIVADVEQAGGSPRLGSPAQADFQQRLGAYNAHTFLAMLRTVSASGGDPPVPARWRHQAEEVINGEIAPDAAVRDPTDRVELLPGELDRMIELAQAHHLDSRPLLWAAGRLAAALSLPRTRLVQLLGGPGAPNATDAQAAAVIDPASALERAASTPEPEDDIAVLQSILLASPPPDPQLFRRAAERAIALVDGGHAGDEVAQIVAFLELRTPAAGLAELDAGLSDAALRLLETPLSHLMRLTLSTHTTRALIRRGRPDLAETVVAQLGEDLSGDERLQLACLRAEIRSASSDDDGAASVLLDALAEADGAGFEARWQALSQLLAVWMPDRHGLERWISEFEAMFSAVDEQLARLGRRQVELARRKAARAQTDS